MKVIRPLHSNEAHGTIAGILTFSRRHGQNLARKIHKPGKPATQSQLAQRASFKSLIADWKALTDNEKTVWGIVGSRLSFISGYHLYLHASVVWRSLHMFGNAKFGQAIFGGIADKG